MFSDAKIIIDDALKSAMPEAAVKEALGKMDLSGGRLTVVAIGKAAWKMANAAYQILGDRVDKGIVITKYEHSEGPIGNFDIYEAGHPVPDVNGYAATSEAIRAVSNLTSDDKVLLLISGGGSALFEQTEIDEEEMADISSQLLACGADITEMNTIRKRLSKVKGGRFAKLCEPAHVYTIVLSDIIGDPLDMIASGPAYPDSSTCRQAMELVDRYHINLSEKASELLKTKTPKELHNVETYVTGSVKQLCKSAMNTAEELGYETVFLTACMNCEAREAGKLLGQIARDHQDTDKSLAFIAGGETVVHLTGKGKGGRNQEIALAAAAEIKGLKDTYIFSVGSDGTDGPTDAAGGIVDDTTALKLKNKNIDLHEVMRNNDSYNALKAVDGLIMTGPTGTNVNDLTVVLIKR